MQAIEAIFILIQILCEMILYWRFTIPLVLASIVFVGIACTVKSDMAMWALGGPVVALGVTAGAIWEGTHFAEQNRDAAEKRKAGLPSDKTA